MGFFRIRKTIRIAPGFRLNLSRSGVSASVGKHGASINVGGVHGSHATVGVPGTGVSYTERLSEPDRPANPAGHPVRPANAEVALPALAPATPKPAGHSVRLLVIGAALVGLALLVRYLLGA